MLDTSKCQTIFCGYYYQSETDTEPCCHYDLSEPWLAPCEG